MSKLMAFGAKMALSFIYLFLITAMFAELFPAVDPQRLFWPLFLAGMVALWLPGRRLSHRALSFAAGAAAGILAWAAADAVAAGVVAPELAHSISDASRAAAPLLAGAVSWLIARPTYFTDMF